MFNMSISLDILNAENVMISVFGKGLRHQDLYLNPGSYYSPLNSKYCAQVQM